MTFLAPASFRVPNGSGSLSKEQLKTCFWSRDVVGNISVIPTGSVRSATTDAFIFDGDVKTIAIAPQAELRLPLQNLSLFDVRITGEFGALVKVSLQNEWHGTVYRFGSGALPVPWRWYLGSNNPLILPDKMCKMFLVIETGALPVQLHYQQLWFAKGARPIGLGSQSLLISLDHTAATDRSTAWFITNSGGSDKIVQVESSPFA